MLLLRRNIACLLTVWLLFSSALAETVAFIAPKLSSDADPYNEEHPEELQANQLYANSAILIEASTGKVIFEKNAEAQAYPASTTKIMTIYLAALYGNLEETVYLSEQDTYGIEPGVDADMGLQVGESINFKDLLYGTFIRSANEGANLIAESVAGGNISAFVDMMNQTAVSLGCTGTHFVNPNGLHSEDHYTTAYDMALIARAAMQNELFRDIAKCYTYSLPKSNLHRSRVLTHSSRKFFNPTLEENEYYYPDAIGIKTGYTSQAGYCFVGAAQRNGIELISVVFYTSEAGRWTDTKKLMEYGFSQFISMTPAELYAANPLVVQTTSYSMEDEGYGKLQLNCVESSGSRNVRVVATVAELEEMARTLKQTAYIEYTRDFVAPISAGEVVGHLTYYPEDGSETAVYDLVASRNVEARTDAPPTLEEIEERVRKDKNPFPPFSVDLMAFFAVPFMILMFFVTLLIRRHNRRTKKYAGGSERIPEPKNRYYR